MWLKRIFGTKARKKARKNVRNHSWRGLLDKLHNDTNSMQQQLNDLQQLVSQQRTVLTEHSSLLVDHKLRFEKLEQLVTQPAPTPPVESPRQIIRPQQAPAATTQQQFNIDGFSTQERRILQVFFEHPDMALSYDDIAKALSKSHLTIKNQVHQIGLKADMFTKSIGADNRNRFKLKDGLRLQKYVDLS